MASESKLSFLSELTKRFGTLRKLERSQSLYEIGDGAARIYIRYSRIHDRRQTFYGLREEDLHELEGHPSVICFLWNSQTEPLLVPFAEFEEVFQSTSPAGDGQYKVQVYLQDEGAELYIAQAGRFNVEGYLGWRELSILVDSTRTEVLPDFSHSQMQTFLGAIGAAKSYEVWIPASDRVKLDWSLTNRFECCDALSFYGIEQVKNVLEEIDVIWIKRGSSELKALFEVEHSSPIYSGLLRLNDIHLAAPHLNPRFSIVANNARRSLFVRQLNRPTFQTSGLNKLCTFLEYVNVFGWYKRVKSEIAEQ